MSFWKICWVPLGGGSREWRAPIALRLSALEGPVDSYAPPASSEQPRCGHDCAQQQHHLRRSALHRTRLQEPHRPAPPRGTQCTSPTRCRTWAPEPCPLQDPGMSALSPVGTGHAGPTPTRPAQDNSTPRARTPAAPRQALAPEQHLLQNTDRSCQLSILPDPRRMRDAALMALHQSKLLMPQAPPQPIAASPYCQRH